MKTKRHAVLPPGSCVGVLGGGQLGRMLAMDAARLGYRVHVYCDRADAPAAQVASCVTVAALDDDEALECFASDVDVVTIEFENLPVATLEYLALRVCIYPGPDVLRICQDRILEKEFLSAHAHQTVAPYAVVRDLKSLQDALALLHTPAILKSARSGYDGHGQARIDVVQDAPDAWEAIGMRDAVLEAFVEFDAEISVVVARSQDGTVLAFEPTWNEHRDHVLWRSHVPAPCAQHILDDAKSQAEHIICALDMVGVLAVEFFVLPGGALYVNELAPRPHNSGHWTLDACHTSQFEQLVRVVCGLPLGDVTRTSCARMTNLFGDETQDVTAWLKKQGCHVHVYGKKHGRVGRKMGHVTEICDV